MEKLGFIGMGNMAQALAAGFVGAGQVATSNVFAFAPNQDRLRTNAERIGFVPCASAAEVCRRSEWIFLACKPHQVEGVLDEVGDGLRGKKVVSVALGWNYARLNGKVGGIARLQFVMPNTPALVREGVFLFEKSNSLLPEERARLAELFLSLGVVEELDDSLMGIGGAVAGCGPAFVDLLIEAYADAAVKYGIPRATAYRLVSQMVLGTARLQLSTGTHPGALKDAVCSPGGTTIRGVAALEAGGFRSACIGSIDEIMRYKAELSRS